MNEKKIKIGIILGTRPEIIKLSPIIRECQKRKINFFILHTNQHYSNNMDKIFFDELELPQPKYNLKITSSNHGDMTGKQIIEIEKILINEKPSWIIVQGDTNTVMAGAIAASKIGIKITHVEAGLRSYDREMPEEINRIVTDHISDLLFTPTKKQANILDKEGIDKNKIIVTGNTIVDAVYQNIKLLKKHPELNHYQKEKYYLLTSHRPSNVDNKENLKQIINSVTQLAKENQVKIIFPIHPRTQKNLNKFKIKIDKKIIDLIEPVGYLQMLALIQNTQLVLTDSGGIQEEACILKIPSLTLRENTERPETIEVGASILVGADQKKIINGAKIMLTKKRNWKNPFGSGKSSKLIIDRIFL